MPNYFSNLEKQQYINLTTFRKTGVGVTTPVWFAQDGDCVYVMTQPIAGKAKRIRNNPRVEVAPSDMKGTPLGAAVAAQAKIVEGDEAKFAEKTISKKYGLMYSIINFTNRLRGAPETGQRVFIKITPAAS